MVSRVGPTLLVSIVTKFSLCHLMIGQGMNAHKIANIILAPTNQGIDFYQTSIDVHTISNGTFPWQMIDRTDPTLVRSEAIVEMKKLD